MTGRISYQFFQSTVWYTGVRDGYFSICNRGGSERGSKADFQTAFCRIVRQRRIYTVVFWHGIIPQNTLSCIMYADKKKNMNIFTGMRLKLKKICSIIFTICWRRRRLNKCHNRAVVHTQTAFFMEATSRGMRLLKTLAEKDTLETHGYNRIIREGNRWIYESISYIRRRNRLYRNQHRL